MADPKPPKSRFLAWMADLVLVAVFVAVVYRPLVFTTQSLNAAVDWSDLLELTQPTLVYTGNALVRGDLPLWTPNWFAGYPHLAMPSAGVFYPTTILFGLLSFPAAVKTVVLLHCFIAGACSYTLGRFVLDRRVPSLYFAFAAVSGDLVLPAVREAHLWTLQTLAWFPLAVLFAHWLCRGAGWGSVAGLAACIALMVFGGDPQSLAFALLLLAIYSAVLLVHGLSIASSGKKRAIKGGSLCGLGVLLGLGLTGAQLIPSQELYAESVRAQGVAFDYINLGGNPSLLRVLFCLEGDDNWRVMAASRTVLAFAAIGLLFAGRPAVWAALIAAAVCLVYGTMPRWLYENIVQYVPIYNGVRGAFRVMGVVGWAVAYMSAFGVAVWTRPRDTVNAARVAIVSLGVLAVLAALPAVTGSGIAPARLAACGLAAGGMVLALARTRRPWAWAAAAALTIAAAGIEMGWRAQRMDIAGNPNVYPVHEKFAAFSESRQDLDRVALVYHRLVLPHGPAVGLLTGDRIVQGYHGLTLTRYARLFDEVGGLSLAPRDARGRLRDTQIFPDYWLSRAILPVLDRFNVRYIVSIGRPAGFSALGRAYAQHFRQVAEGPVDVYENPSAFPPIYPVHDVIVCATDDEAIALLRKGVMGDRKTITVTGAFDAASLSPRAAPEPITIQEYAPERIVAGVELSTPAVVVFSEMYYPGWRAFVDGEEREILCVNTAFRGVRAEAGKHTIEMRYEPASLRIGAMLSAGTMLAILAISIGVFLNARRRAVRGAEVTPA